MSRVDRVRAALTPVADSERAVPMAAYMKGVAPFLGVPAPARRAAIRPLGQPRADEREFFIRKAIGWALRDYAWRNPDAVDRFVSEHRAELSALTIREATKNLAKARIAPRR